MNSWTVAMRDGILGVLRDHDTCTTNEVWERLGHIGQPRVVYINLRALARKGDVIQVDTPPGQHEAIWVIDPRAAAQAEADTPRDALERLWRLPTAQRPM